ncbi:MAG TPA: FGGY-family carbohydrate kinase, partial [Spirochaetia bacterium]|nr:FGGY-family carbohydrate kinase [Spirochaetia bacterium]
GGGAASDLWNQIKADVTGNSILTLECNESSSLGMAMIQSVACGVHTCLEEAASTMVRARKRFEPDLTRHDRYRELYARYWSTLESLYFK